MGTFSSFAPSSAVFLNSYFITQNLSPIVTKYVNLKIDKLLVF